MELHKPKVQIFVLRRTRSARRRQPVHASLSSRFTRPPCEIYSQIFSGTSPADAPHYRNCSHQTPHLEQTSGGLTLIVMSRDRHAQPPPPLRPCGDWCPNAPTTGRDPRRICEPEPPTSSWSKWGTPGPDAPPPREPKRCLTLHVDFPVRTASPLQHHVWADTEKKNKAKI